MFTESFGRYVCVGDSIDCESEPFTVTARIEFDPDYRIDDNNYHNPDQSVTGCNDEQQEKLLAARSAWENDDWFYCGVVLSVSVAGVVLDKHAASLWGIECNYPGSDNSYLSDVANELLDEALEAGRQVLETVKAAA
ncbi:MAG: hypothetical protein H7842_02530 [Gammaproteobacteria bacterium SHHR-1]